MRGVAESTLLLTVDGYRPADSLRAGDLLLAPGGRLTGILEIREGIGRACLLRGHHYGIACGEETRILVVDPRKKGGAPEPADVRDAGGLSWVLPRRLARLPLDVPGNGELPRIKPHLWRFVGRYLADGWITGDREVDLCDSCDKAGEILRLMEQFGRPCSRYERENTVRIRLYSRSLHDWLHRNFGKYAYGKTLPGWVYGLQTEERRELMEGALDGDGTRCPGKNDRRICTVSERLAEGYRLLLESLGTSVTITRTDRGKFRTIQGRRCTQRPVYQLQAIEDRLSKGCIHTEEYSAYPLTLRQEEQEIRLLEIRTEHGCIAGGMAFAGDAT